MGIVKNTEIIDFTSEKRLFVFWNVGDGDNGDIDETYGFEIEVEANHRTEDYWNVINIYSFGYEAFSKELWNEWGMYVLDKLNKFEKSEEGYEAAIKWLETISCRYSRGKDHLRDLVYIKQLLSEEK